ncbi:MAG TPA: tetratricopeptide repeat protein [Longimicrobiales bacterium]
MSGDRIDRSELLQRARALDAARDYGGVVELLAPWEAAGFDADPELGYLLAEARRRVGESGAALALLRAIERACRRRGNDRLHRSRLNLLGVLLFERGEITDAVQAWGELLDAASRAGDEDFVARANNNLGVVATLRGDSREALASYQRAITAYQRLGRRRGLAQAHQNLAITFQALGFGWEADAHFRRAIGYAVADGSQDEQARAEQEWALLILELRRDPGLAQAMAYRALERFRAIGDPAGEGETRRVLGIIALAERNLDVARADLSDARETARELGLRLLEAEAAEALAAVEEAAGRTEAAAALRAAAEAAFAAIGAAGWGARFRERIAGIAAIGAEPGLVAAGPGTSAA